LGADPSPPAAVGDREIADVDQHMIIGGEAVLGAADLVEMGVLELRMSA
jgi:hypothetical protein